MKINVQQAYLAGLIHDIGKFYQRADDNGLKKSSKVAEHIKALEEDYCPKYGEAKIPTHKHVIWTAHFIEEFKEIFNKILNLNSDIKKLDFFLAAVRHHSPNKSNLFQLIIQKANHYSAGIDRTIDLNDSDSKAEHQWNDFKKVQMVPILQRINNDKLKLGNYQFVPISKVDLSSNFFPSPDQSNDPESDYTELWNQFTSEFKELDQTDFNAFINTLDSLLLKYFISIPSSTLHLPDVSLYHHLKSAAAFSGCLAQFCNANDLDSIPDKDKNPFLLIGADISGIQTFIYDVTAGGAAKNFKGRSYYLHLLAENIINKILDRLGLYNCNIVYNSGGGFYLIAPNTKDVLNNLAEFEKELTRFLFDTHANSLYVALDSIPFGESNLFEKDLENVKDSLSGLAKIWSELSKRLSKKKNRRYADLLQNDINGYKLFFEPLEVIGKDEYDYYTGQEINNQAHLLNRNIHILGFGEEVSESQWKSDAKSKLNQATFDMFSLGKILRDKFEYHVSVPDQKLDYFPSDKKIKTSNFLFDNYFLNKTKIEESLAKAKGSADGVLINKINKLNFLDSRIKGKNNTLGFEFYGGFDMPRHDNNEVKTFDELTIDSGESAKGKFKRLAFLRMDVDNLGNAFIKGMKSQERTFSRYSAMSFNLDYFFKGYLNTLWENDPGYHAHTYILYSGGDDLFILGDWTHVIRFAETIAQEFKKWVCNNKSLTLSGGIALLPSKFPIGRAAKLSEEAEKAAKNHIWGEKPEKLLEGNVLEIRQGSKSSITLFDTPLNWDFEFIEVKTLKEKLKNFVESNEIPRGFLQKLITYDAMRQNQIKNKQTESWRWMMAYNIARNSSALKTDSSKAFMKEISTRSFADLDRNGKPLSANTNYPFVKLLAVAARWAQLETK